MESLAEFTARIRGFQTDSVPEEADFGLPAALSLKVGPGSGAILPFHGCTIAYFADEEARALVSRVADELHARMRTATRYAAPLVQQARDIGTIRLTCTTVFNLVNTSIVIGLRAADEVDHHKLLRARALFDQLVPGVPFTPHLTVAYYRPAALRQHGPLLGASTNHRTVVTDMTPVNSKAPHSTSPALWQVPCAGQLSS